MGKKKDDAMDTAMSVITGGLPKGYNSQQEAAAALQKKGQSLTPGDGMAAVGQVRYQTNNPQSGSTWNTVPVYGKVAPAAPATNDGGSGGGGKGSGSKPAIPNDGSYGNIEALLAQQQADAAAMAAEYASKEPDPIETLKLEFTQMLKDAASSADARMASLQDLMITQQQQATATQNLLQQQAQAAQAAYEEQARQAAALGKAFVPNLEPTAAAASMGDQRTTVRAKENNNLNQLAIVSGIGSNLNPLAGLQLA